MSSSSESDGEDVTLLKEAIDSQFINDAMYNNKKQTSTTKTERNLIQSTTTAIQLPSLRKNAMQEDDANNYFKVSPEFQKYVSKELAKLLERKLEGMLCDDLTPERGKRKVKGGVKLLRCSEEYLKVPKREKAAMKRRPIVEVEDFDAVVEKCRSVAVTGEGVLGKNEVKFWSKRSKAEVFVYKKGTKGLLLQEKKFV